MDEAFAKKDDLMAELRGNVPLDTLEQAKARMSAKTNLRIENLNLSNVLHARVLLRSSLRDEELRPTLWTTALQENGKSTF